MDRKEVKMAKGKGGGDPELGGDWFVAIIGLVFFGILFFGFVIGLAH